MKKVKLPPKDEMQFYLPKFKKHSFLKTVALLSFFIGGNIIVHKITEEKPLPFNDVQTLPEHPGYTNDELQELEYQMALQAYDLLLNRIYTKSANMGVPLTEDYLLKIVAYDQMTNTIDVIMQNANNNNTVQLKFSAQNLYVLDEPTITISDKISQLMMLLDAPDLSQPTPPTSPTEMKDAMNSAMTA